MALILDTNALSAVLIGDPDIKPVLSQRGPISIPAIVLGEYRYGLNGSTRTEAIGEALDSLSRRVSVVTIDGAATRHYADIRWKLRLNGAPIPENDLWIAAIARRYALPILSRDTHFDAVPGIERVGW